MTGVTDIYLSTKEDNNKVDDLSIAIATNLPMWLYDDPDINWLNFNV